MLVSTLIKAALRKITVIASGETPTTAEYADSLEALQSMLRSWAANSVLVYASTSDTFTLVAGTSTYTWGTGGTFNSARPQSLLGASITDSAGITHPVNLLDEGHYRGITVKTTTGRPTDLFYKSSYPLASVYLYPVPDTVESLVIDSLKPFTETSSFSAITDTLAFPSEYEEAIIYNLSIRLASEFGKAIPIEVADIATKSYDRIVVNNIAKKVESVDISVPAGSSNSNYDINADA